MATKRSKSATREGQTATMSYCIIRSSKLLKRVCGSQDDKWPMCSDRAEALIKGDRLKSSNSESINTTTFNASSSSFASQILSSPSPPTLSPSCEQDNKSPGAQPAACLALVNHHQLFSPIQTTSTTSCHSQDQQQLIATKCKMMNRSQRINWWLLVTVFVLYLSLCNWTSLPRHRHLYPSPALSAGNWMDKFLEGLMTINGLNLAAAQYRPEWPNKALQQEIFLLNLEDGYFGCQVNESQDFLQLFELSRLCDGQAQCYLGTDEMASPLKCNNRDRCGTYTNSRGQVEQVNCLHGVCLDGLCYCNDGWGGKACDVQDENECKFRPCDVFAHCTNTMGSYYCSCFPGYDGDGMHCQDINECEIPSLAALCQDNSECCNLPGHFVCKCKPGYQQSGQSLSSLTGAPSGNTSVSCTDIDECLDERSCGRGASCENLPGSFRCACPPGFTGDPAIECIDMDECRNSPCGVGAQCTNIPGGYRCSCAPGFERNPQLAASRFGSIQTLSESLTAVNSSIVACLDINECTRSQQTSGSQTKLEPACGLGAQCINTPGAHFCQCPAGYTGNPKVACLDIDECAAHACGPNSQCKNTPGGYQCDCKPGYTGNAYSATEGCQDEDECLKKDSCGQNAQCFNTLGGHECSCLPGYTGDPRSRCTDIDECSGGSNPCGPGAQCYNQPGGYKCACPDKYLARGSPEMGCERAAVDIGCSTDLDCTNNALCLNATCQCKMGFQISGIECVDVDECSPLVQLPSLSASKSPSKLSLAIQQSSNLSSLTANNLCGLEANCVNLEGAYRCECREGYEKLDPQSPISKCRDINECEQIPSVCGQNNRCFNTGGGYKCACQDGFIPIDSEPSNGCKSPCDGIDCGQHATCKPHGEEAACVCKTGFTFDPNNIKLGCVDINECDPNYGPSGLCGHRAICTNIPGGHRCHCPAGYSGDAYRYCEDINECDRRFGVFGQCGELAVCNNTQGSFGCSCAPGYTGDPRIRCHDIDECSPKLGPHGKCGLNAICTNAPGRYSCRCPPNHSGDPHERCLPDQPACSSSVDCGPNELCKSGRCHCPFAQHQQQDLVQATTECRHPCTGTECGPHATCRLDADNLPLCVCDAGFMAPGDGRSGCLDVNECIQGVTLSGVTPLSALNAGAGVAVGPAASNTTGGHPCGRNALCRNHPGSFDCTCPPGHSGDPYMACLLDVRSQELPPTTTTTTTTTPTMTTTSMSSPTSGGSAATTTQQPLSGNYQQEPRTTACADQVCPRNHICLDGQCVRLDACRDHHDCRPSQACEVLAQSPQLGYQCVNVCDLRPCGPEARCQPLNHKPICSCNSSAGYAGDPYNLITGCQLITEIHRSTAAGGSSSGSDMEHHSVSTVAFEFNSQSSNSTQVSGNIYETSQTRRPTGGANQPLLVDYELPLLPTTPPGLGLQGKQNLTIGTRLPLPVSQGDKLLQPPTQLPTNTQNNIVNQLAPTKQQQSQAQAQPQPQQPLNLFNRKKPPSAISSTPQPPLSPVNSQQRNQEQQQQLIQGGQIQEDYQSSYASTSNKSSLMISQQRQVSCQSDQHCPGNLFCLSRQCSCPQGYKREADYCYLQRVNCSSSIHCKHREECISASVLIQQQQQQFSLQEKEEAYGGICICPHGYKLTQSGVACIDRNECDEGAPCAVGAVCQNKIGSYECVCPPGTSGEPYTKTCEPISKQQLIVQECQSSSDCASDRECDIVARKCVSPCYVCGPRAHCTVANHVAICLCPRGYTGNAIDLVYGCQEQSPPMTTSTANPQTTTTTMVSSSSSTTTPPTTTTTTTNPTTQRPQQQREQTTTAVGVPVTTLLPSTTTVAPLETTTPVVEFRTIPPAELYVMCLADGIQVDVQLGGFDGIIYVKGHSQDPKCRKLVMSSSPSEYINFKVQFGHCDLIHRDGEAGFVLVIQKHPKLVTYRARAYHVKCVYNTGERTVTLGFNVSMITTSGTIANTGPPPTCLMSITALDGREVTSAEIGQDLLLRVDVQPDSIYGGFARSCEAKTMDDEGEYQYEVTDANGCATDPSIFSDWKYDQQRKSLVARFNAFKFPSSNNLRFQCNIRVCFGSCPAVNCNGIDAYGKRRKRRAADSNQLGGSNSTSDSFDEANNQPVDELIVTDAFKEGALREEVMVQSNAILTFDKKEASLPQRGPQVEDIEFVCLPRLGMMMSIVLTTLLALLALAIATSCWCFTKRRRQRKHQNGRGPLPHPVDFPNPLMRSSSSSTLREPIYGP